MTPLRGLGGKALAWAPVITVGAFMLPIVAGLAGTMLPALGYMPALGGHALSLAPWRELLAYPGFATSLRLTLFIGIVSTVLSAALALGFCAVAQGSGWARRAGRCLTPVLAMPHSALAIGIAFMLAPSGWVARLLSPWLTGWNTPPDITTLRDATGWSVVLGLLLKEVPYLILMTMGALNQVPATQHVRIARSLGYSRVQGWVKLVLPQIYPQIRLPICAVLAFSLSVVDVPLILGPGNPPPLAVLAVRWFSDPDTRLYFPAAAAACLQLLVVLAMIGLLFAMEKIARRAGARWIERGRRRGAATALAGGAALLGGALFALVALTLVALGLWSFAARWRFPSAWPSVWTLANWQRQLPSFAGPAWNTLLVGLAATLIALALVLACLENEARHPARQRASLIWLLYLPLLVPQVAFLFGAQVLLVRFNLDATRAAVIWAHLVFVLPYLFLSLADPWRAFDSRLLRSARSLGAPPLKAFVAIKLPILLAPLLIACAVAFAVSVGQYLPTLFAGNGRVATLTTEAVTLTAGADRRVIGVWALVQAGFPWLAYLAAVITPWWVFRHRRGMKTWS